MSGLIFSRSGECERAAAAFGHAMKGPFQLRWQRVAALNSAARAAEGRGDDETAVDLYKKAFAIAPLNAQTTSNLMVFHWSRNNIPNAAAYADLLKAGNADPLVRVLWNEFQKERERSDSAAARDMKKTDQNSPGTSKSSDRRTVVVPDFSVIGCTPELNGLGCAGAGYLRECLQSHQGVLVPNRSQIRAAAEIKGFEVSLDTSVRLKKAAAAVLGDYFLLGEVAAYEDSYLLNVRVAEVKTGEVEAVFCHKLPVLDALAPALEQTAGQIVEYLQAQ